MASACPVSSSKPSRSKYFNSDRLRKYGYGTIRLLFLIIITFSWNLTTSSLDRTLLLPSLLQYFSSFRWILHVYIGTIGAIVNVNQFTFMTHMIFLFIAGISIIYDIYTFDRIMIIYLLKTFSGDYISGKLDTMEWKWVLFYTFGIILPSSLISIPMQELFPHTRILVLLFVIQFICEYGDHHWEDCTLFRHRYSFEILNLALVLFIPSLQPFELKCIQFDLIICLFYRFSNFILCVLHDDTFSKYCLKYVISVTSWYLQLPLQIVDDPVVASLVLKHSICKGYGIEQNVATSAWAPLLSLESVDGELWSTMRRNFDSIMKILPDLSHLQQIAEERVNKLVQVHVKDNRIIDADAVARVTAEILGIYVFGSEIVDRSHAIDVLVKASWEWRKEISARGRANTQIKLEAIRIVIDELLPLNPALCSLFGGLWSQAEYHSLLIQPFFISPIINTGDIMCASQLHPGLSLDQLLKAMHPFPILERFVTSDLMMDNCVVVKANTQVLMFSTDFRESNWPVFGSGLRSCAGMHLAMVFLKAMLISFQSLDGRLFQPMAGHKYSGRHLDGKSEGFIEGLLETVYFMRIIWKILRFPKLPPRNPQSS